MTGVFRAISTQTRVAPATSGLLLSRPIPTSSPRIDDATMTTADTKSVLAMPTTIAHQFGSCGLNGSKVSEIEKLAGAKRKPNPSGMPRADRLAAVAVTST